MEKTKKNRRGGVFTHGNNQNRNHVACLSFRVDPLNWQTFIEIGEIARSATAWCSRGHTLNGVRNNFFSKILFVIHPRILHWHRSESNGLLTDNFIEQNIKLASFNIYCLFIPLWTTLCNKIPPPSIPSEIKTTEPQGVYITSYKAWTFCLIEPEHNTKMLGFFRFSTFVQVTSNRKKTTSRLWLAK